MNDALQPGGGATSDSTFSDDRDDKAFARQRSHSDYGGRDGGLYGSDASEDALVSHFIGHCYRAVIHYIAILISYDV